MTTYPDIDVTRLKAGPYIDRLVAEQVLGWHHWHGGPVTDTRTFVVNPVTRQIERCRPTVATVDTDYPECSKAYAFSTHYTDALEVLQVLPIETMPGIPQEAMALCRLALQWTQRMVCG